MKRWWLWAIGSVAALIVSAFALLNVHAAVDLGYDASSEGKAIIARWGDATLGALVASATCGVMAILAW